MEAEKAKSHLHSQALGSVTDWEDSIGIVPSRPFSPLEMISAIDSRNLNPNWVGRFRDSCILV